jgi:hypothetical protein
MMRESLPIIHGPDDTYQTPLGAESADVLDDKRLDRKDRPPVKSAPPAESAVPQEEKDPELDAYLDFLVNKGESWVD